MVNPTSPAPLSPGRDRMAGPSVSLSVSKYAALTRLEENSEHETDASGPSLAL